MTAITQPAAYKSDVNILAHVKIEHLLAGLSGGVASTLILHPLDVVKIRLAAHDGRHVPTPKYTGISNAFVTIFRQEGIRGFYKGVTPNCWGAGASWGLYFFFYNSMKTWAYKQTGQVQLGPLEHMLAASGAGCLTLLLTNPLWVVKTRLCLQHNNTMVQYTGMMDALVKIYQLEGIRGYYRGLLPGLFGVSHGAVQFMVYEEMKNKYYNHYAVPEHMKLGTMQYLTFAAASKLIAAGITYPYQVVRTRLQNQFYSYKGTWNCMEETWRFEGWRGFYKGLGTNLLRVTPATMITFVTYENVSHFLLKSNRDVRVASV